MKWYAIINKTNRKVGFVAGLEGIDLTKYDTIELTKEPTEFEELVGSKLVENKSRKEAIKEHARISFMNPVEFQKDIETKLINKLIEIGVITSNQALKLKE